MKEYYVDKPAEIEVYTHGGCTDIILRKSIAQESDEDGNMRWTCEERQMRQPGTISAESVKADFSIFWAVAGGEEPLNTIKANKTAEMSAACRAAISVFPRIVYHNSPVNTRPVPFQEISGSFG